MSPDHPHTFSPLTIAVTGAAGMLGSDVVKAARRAGIITYALGKDHLDITDPESCRRALKGTRPSVVINCAAYTQVDLAESEPETAATVNGAGPRNIAATCREMGAHLVHVSTDYVFDGKKTEPYVPQDITHPINVYGETKLQGEQAIAETMEPGTWTIARTSWLFGANGPNFVRTMLRLAGENRDLKVICDQTGSPTYTVDLADALVAIAQARPGGILHTTGSGCCTWYDFAREIFAQSGVQPVSLSSCSTADYPTPATRPLNSRLCSANLAAAGIAELPHWKDALKRYLDETGDVHL